MNTTKECFFCTVPDNDILWEDDLFFVRMDDVPVTPGHFEIIPKQHIANLEELTPDEWIRLYEIIPNMVEVIVNMDLEGYYQHKLKNLPFPKAEAFLKDAYENSKKFDLPFTDYNFGVNNGRLAGRTVDHLHFHIIPRYKGDVDDPVGGILNVIPNKANYHSPLPTVFSKASSTIEATNDK